MAKVIGKSFALATVFSLLLLIVGSLGITVYALTRETSLGIANVYTVTVEENGSFYITAGPGAFVSFLVVLALLTLLISVGQLRSSSSR